MSLSDPALYLAFRLGGEVYAIDILRIREIVEYSAPASVPLMPPAVRGVTNLRGTVVPLIDLGVRFGRGVTTAGKRTCFVIVETEHAGTPYTLGLMVDGVNGVMDIPATDIEAPPAFGMQVDNRFIAGIRRAVVARTRAQFQPSAEVRWPSGSVSRRAPDAGPRLATCVCCRVARSPSGSARCG